MTAILYERGRFALEAGDRPAAEKLWHELIDLALVQPRLPKTAAAPGKGAGRIPATLSQFKLGASIAQAAADHDLVALSLLAIREALSGGVPVADLPKAGALLERLIADLEAYVALNSAAVKPPPVSRSSAAPPPEPVEASKESP